MGIVAESGVTVIVVKVAVEVAPFEPPPPHPARSKVKTRKNPASNLTVT
jgi:hypothetical protein